jgi:hypothetical protein
LRSAVLPGAIGHLEHSTWDVVGVVAGRAEDPVIGLAAGEHIGSVFASFRIV